MRLRKLQIRPLRGYDDVAKHGDVDARRAFGRTADRLGRRLPRSALESRRGGFQRDVSCLSDTEGPRPGRDEEKQAPKDQQEGEETMPADQTHRNKPVARNDPRSR